MCVQSAAMAVIIPEGYGNAAIRVQLDGKPREFVTTVGFKPDPAVTSPNSMASLLRLAFTSGGGPASSPANILDGWTFIGVTVTFMGALGPLPGESVSHVIGAASAGSMPPNGAYLIRKQTARGGKQGRGRFYVPPFNLSELSVDNLGVMSSGTVTALQTQWQAFFDACTVTGVPLYLLHDNPLPPRLPPPPDILTAIFIESQTATQRRRLRR